MAQSTAPKEPKSLEKEIRPHIDPMTKTSPTIVTKNPTFSNRPERSDWRNCSPTRPRRMSSGADQNIFQKTLGVWKARLEMEMPVGESAHSRPPGTHSMPLHLRRNDNSLRKTSLTSPVR